MTDNEIIKALKCHADKRNNCINCYYRERGCSLQLASDALDLINRQKEEIERLKKQVSNNHDVMMNIVKANGG